MVWLHVDRAIVVATFCWSRLDDYAVAGGILGALTEAGVSEEDAQVYAEGVRRGGTLLTVRVPEADKAGIP